MKYPREFRNHSINAPEGRTIFPALKGKKLPKRDLFFEHQTSCGIISGDWKLVRANGKQPWELFHLLQDPFEQNDLSANYPEKVKTLEKNGMNGQRSNTYFHLNTGHGQNVLIIINRCIPISPGKIKYLSKVSKRSCIKTLSP